MHAVLLINVHAHSCEVNPRRHLDKDEVKLMATSINSRQTDFSEMDNAGISKEHWKIMFISGVGFFTDAYDLFIIGVVMALLKPMWHVGKVEEGLVESTALLAASGFMVSKCWFLLRVQSLAPSPPTSGGSSVFGSFSGLGSAATILFPPPL